MSKGNKESSGIFIRVTEDYNKTLTKLILKSPAVAELKTKGYDIDKSVIGRFGFLFVCKNFDILGENLDLLLAASKTQASDELLAEFAKDGKK